ncbi:E3 ubiquitin-protein ligase rnf213-alpha [Acropora cervicornis]|uniref:E3 ubiquitin-protein ligase rnf213-alpha n=1 Tax=Acropora cervicornis TaxID=6130 RepID=A0AAD9Q1Y8_ACRCE|nr:E3 ubiquitin-protein ligase rnf213-alpha [Acropora cervicornis]
MDSECENMTLVRSQEEIVVSLCLDLALTFIQRLSLRNDPEVILLSIKLFFTSVHKREIGQENITDERMDKLLWELKKKVITEFGSQMAAVCHHREQLLKELQLWTRLLRAADGYQGAEIYRSHLTKQFVDGAAKMRQIELVEVFCDINLDQYDRAIEESFTTLAFEAVEKIIKSQERGDTDRAIERLSQRTNLSTRAQEKCGELLSMLLAKSWPKSTQGANTSGLDPVTVNFLLSWKSMAAYFRFFGDESERGTILTPDGQETLSLAKSLLTALVQRISDSSITVATLEILKKYKDRFLELLEADSSIHNKRTKEAERSLNDRIREIQEFQDLRKKLLSFIHLCELIQPVNVTAIKKNVKKDVSFCEIGNLCQRNDDNSDEVNFFKLPPGVGEVLYPLHEVQQSLTFRDLWRKYGKRAQTARMNDDAQQKELSILKVLESVWKPAYEAWKQIAVSTLDGSICLGDVDKYFSDFKGKEEELETELFCILKVDHSHSITDDQLEAITKKRAEQMQLYQEIHQYTNEAETIWEFKEAMGFSGDFKIVEDLRYQLSAEFKKKCLNTIGNELTEASRALERLNVDKGEWLKKVVESKRLVEWLRTTITSTQELKVLVDLALISAGESDMETDRISDLHTSCLGFAPLIFDLKETETNKVDFAQLMKACESVRNAVKADRRLPQKLCDTSRQLEWLKTVKESHGSVAMTSLVQAEMINSSGVYVVGRLHREQDSRSEKEERLSLEHVVHLTVPPKESGGDNAQDIEYSLDEIKDLQSKLMLIAGKAEKGKDEVDTFVKNLEGITRLAKAYINLSESGFVHRMDWTQEFRCSRDELEGESVSQELARVSTVMEDCLSKWKQKVSDARKEYRELNFFNTQQLMLLRKEIARACHRSPFEVGNPQVFTLLESVRPNLYTEHLMEAVERAFQDTNLLEQAKDSTGILPSFSLAQHHVDSQESLYRNNSYMPSTAGLTAHVQSAPVKKPTPKPVSKIRRFLNAAEDGGYSEQVALCALASLGVEAEEDDLLLWCLEDSDDADLESLYDEAINNPAIAEEMISEEIALDQESEFEGSSESDDELKSGSCELPQSSIERNESGNEDEEQKISEYLTLLQLGLILRELAIKGKGSRPRSFPAFLRRGRPNLMLAPKGDILATVLALYMHDKDQPLPSQEEVLICTPETNTEEIELLWRRAIGDLEGRFYCLVNADELDFSVSKEAIDRLDELTKGLAGKNGENYGLVVICSSESEDRANIVAALDQYRVAALACPSPEAVRSYLEKQFGVPPPQYGYINNSKITWSPAGSLDPAKLCVRVVSSNRGGLGKTLFVRRLTDQLPNLVNNDMVLSHCSNTSLHVTVPLHGNSTDSSMLVDSLLPHGVRANVPLSRVFHLDVAPSVRRGLDTLLFNLLVLGSLCDTMGRLWRRRSSDLYIIEITTNAPLPAGFSREEEAQNQERQSGKSRISKKPFYDLLPTITCASPRTISCCSHAKPDPNDFNPGLDIKEFQSPHFQRVYQYLKLSQQGVNLDNFTFVPGKIDEDQETCLSQLLSFLNSQLRDCEQSSFCDMKLMRAVLAGPDVPNLEGFRSFVVRFMIQMSRDFATPSLTDENTVFYTKDDVDLERQEIEHPHPYLFFNEDHITMTFLGFSINSNGDLVDPQTSTILEKGLMSKSLRNGLHAQGVDFTVNSESWSKCNIPVIVMGETGCGKTRLIRFMCGLQAGPNGPRNMLLVKVHGGTTYKEIEAKVKQAEEMARENQDKNIDTVLFFDEANTTEALSMIKEVMVDRRIRGRRIGLGHIPLRHLVYRVHALPGSMRPLIWDFGQLNHQVETLYTNQIVGRYIVHERKLPGDTGTVHAIASDECSFVSLRDVERAMQVMVWFYNRVDVLGKLMTGVLIEQRRQEGYDVTEDDGDVDEQEAINPVTRALVLAIGVCYHAKLQERRQDFRKMVAESFKAPCHLPGGEKQIHREITSCQRAVLNELELGPNIARNTALSENVFMMVVCIELRIPLFVVGKPGSSKSLAKTVVADNMQGDAARSELFKAFKQVHMASYQCSPLSTPEGIVGTFRQCRKLQEGKNLDRFVSVVVLDEVGLAEDSPLMPLKALHPLLEDGVTSSDDVIETDEKPQRVAFIGISNWALDPAKMNRGIMLSRGVPDVQELVDSALGICSTDQRIKNLIQPLIPPLANGYAELYKEQENFETLKKCGKEEFFGLRDYYSLIKMVYAIAAKSRQQPEVESSTTIRLIEASLAREDVADQANFSENRYLLILTENYAALRIMQQQLLKTSDNAIVIFGSSFPNDQEYTQVCRNINRIKVCMETGRTVILLNLESLYESLYDALNQYYVYLGGQKYVDLGLGTHRVKCRVHDDFKLIVIAEKEVVYNTFPIPLINRLEKHFLVTSTSLRADQMELVEKLKTWANAFAKCTTNLKEMNRRAFCKMARRILGKMVRRCKSLLLEMATPDAIARLPASGIKNEAKEIWKVYFNEQQHSSLAAFMGHVLQYDDYHLEKKRQEGLLVQITSHSRLLSKNDLFVLCEETGFSPSTVDFMTLQQFQTEQQFRSLVRLFFERNGGDCSGILIVQCDSGDDNFNLIAGARHILMEERNNAPELLGLSKIKPVHIAVVVQLPRIAGGCRNFVGFQGGQWMSFHIDELRPPGRNTPPIDHLINRPISELFCDANETQQETTKKVKLLAVNLLRNCVQAAACRIDNEGGTPDRSTQRIELLLQLLPEDFEESGGTGVQEWGTFRKALWKRVYSSVVPILAEIIALADTDSNLDLMKDGSPWVSILWLRILANPRISEMSYSKMISPVTNSVRERVQVLGSGARGHTFQCMFPFSFLVKHQVDKLLNSAFSVAATSSATLVESLRDLIANSETGRLFDGLQHDHARLSAFTYLSDYVHMVYTPSDKSEHELVFSAVLSSARELGVEIDDDGNELLDIALIHVAHSRIMSRLRCFAKLAQAQPAIVGKLTKIFTDTESEVLLDVVALTISLEELQPSDKILLDPVSAREWCDKVLSIRQAVEVMMSTGRFQVNTEMNACYGDKAKMLIGRCRSMWQRAGAVRLFVEHVTFFSEQSCFESVLGLWKALDEETDFASLRSLQIIEKFLINYSQEAQKRDDESDLRRRCNAFFMELVALFCFGESSKDLQEDALLHLMQYVIVQHSTQTKVPLYLLLIRQAFVKDYLDVFLREAQRLQRNPRDIKEVCFLCIQCVEDNLISRYQAKIPDTKLTVQLKQATKICNEVSTALEDVASSGDEPYDMNANALESVAKGRHVLTRVADYLYKFFIKGDSSISVDHDVKREFASLLEAVKRLCPESPGPSTPHMFLVRQLVRCYGFDCVRTLGRYQELEWIVPPDARQEEEHVIQDRFVVHLKPYRDNRELLAKGIISGNIEDFAAAVTEVEVENVYKDVLLLLALYREVTCSQSQSVSDEAQPFAKQLLQNRQGGDFRGLEVFPGKSAQDHTLAEIVIHTSIALHCIGSGSLTGPLYILMTDPSSMANSYLPTIPEDNFLDCIKVIAECSQPMEKTQCPGCGGVLGGEQHQFLGEYEVAKRQDRTKTGHALGEPGSRPTNAEPQRNLSPILCSLLRILMHASMVMGACKNAQATAQVIKPRCEPCDAAEFLWRHLQRDLDVLGRALGRSVDDAALTVHLVLHRMISLNGRETGITFFSIVEYIFLPVCCCSFSLLLVGNAHNIRLVTKESRLAWETDFSSVVIAPVIRELDQNLQKASKLLMEDERFEQYCNLSHTLALWRLMALEKAKIKSRNKQEPFEEMPEFLKGKLSSSDAAHLNRVLRKIDMELFLPRLLEMILLKNVDEIPGIENIPDAVHMKHLQAVWNSAVLLCVDSRSRSQYSAA